MKVDKGGEVERDRGITRVDVQNSGPSTDPRLQSNLNSPSDEPNPDQTGFFDAVGWGRPIFKGTTVT